MTDLDVIKQLEEELKVRLEQSDEIEYRAAYTLDEKGQVSGVGLYDCQ